MLGGKKKRENKKHDDDNNSPPVINAELKNSLLLIHLPTLY
jgi:hypothetical protein